MEAIKILIKKMKIMRNILFITIILTSGLTAQKDTSGTNLQLNQVEVIKAFEANLEDAQKVSVKSVLPVQKPFNPKYTYDITIVPIELKYPDPQIKPLAMNPDGPFKVNKGYFDAGYGLRKNPKMMAGYHFSKKDTYDAGFHVNYESLNNSTNQPFQKYRNAGIDFYGNYLIKENMKLYGEVNTSLNKRYFYHTDLPVDSLYSDDKSSRNLHSYGIKAGISNAEPTTYNINYDVSLALQNLSVSNEEARENGIAIESKVEKLFRKNTILSVSGQYNYIAFSSSKEVSLTTAVFQPLLKTKIKNFIIHAGANFLYSSDGQSSVWPEINLSYGVAGPNLQVFAGISQNFYTNSFRNVTQINPYLNSNLDSLNNTVIKSYFAGIKGQFSFLNYQIKAGLKDAGRQMFLLNTREDVRYFDMLFDDVNIVFVTGNLDFTLYEDVTLGGWLTQNVYDLNTLSNAWHTPDIEGNVYLDVKLLDRKLNLKSDLYFGNRVSFINKTDVVTKSNLLFDFNLSAAYKISEKVNVYIRGINLLDNKFERWYGYPSVGINGMAGFRVLF